MAAAVAPWTAIKTDPERAAVIVRTALNLAALYAKVSAPFIPYAAETIASALGQAYPPAWPGEDMAKELDGLTRDAKINVPPVLFQKIEDSQIAEWSERFGGAEA